jgi:hypothetical protein
MNKLIPVLVALAFLGAANAEAVPIMFHQARMKIRRTTRPGQARLSPSTMQTCTR